MRNFKGDDNKPYIEYKNENLDDIIQILKKNNSFYYDYKINIEIVNKIEFASKSFGNKVTRTSIRNIYNAFKDIEMQLNQKYINKMNIDEFGEDECIDVIEYKMNKQKEDVFNEIKPIIKLMNGKIHYLISRKKEALNRNAYSEKRAYEDVQRFFKESINVIDKYEEFEAFLKIFECMYGYLEKGSGNQ